MTDRRVTEDTAILGANVASGDLFDLVDVSDTTDAATGTSKKILASEVAIAITALGSLATDAEVASAVAALSSVYQPLDADLTAIAALATTAFGRGLLILADAAAGRTALGLGTAATHATTDYDASGAAAAAQAASQPLDADLTAIAALTTTAYGRGLLELANAAAGDWITKALVDVKGDLLVATADNTVGRLAVGTDTHVLTADSGQASGVKWAAAAGGAPSGSAGGDLGGTYPNPTVVDNHADHWRVQALAGSGGTETVTASVGNFAAGFVSGYGSYTGAITAGTANGAFAQGYVLANGHNASVAATARGAFAQGFAGYGDVLASGVGAFAQGATRSTAGVITSSGDGSFAQGSVYTGAITASAKGAFAQGYSTYGSVLAAAAGAFAQGYTYDSGNYIKADGIGNFAQGSAFAYNIRASGFGAVAMGHTEFSDIIADGNNVVQFGCGTNDVSNSLQVGLSTRFHSDGYIELKEAPATPTVAANSGQVYTEDNGSGKTRLMVKFNTGSAIQLAIEP